jgi:hypothetical protein
MSTDNQFSIPYERQNHAEGTRQCGAACLSMVYRSFDKVVPQLEIWRAIARVDRFGGMGARTHLMAQDALGRGFQAMAVQTSQPITALRKCCDSGVRVILNHSLEAGKPAGHYSVLLSVDEKNVYVHDPQAGPSREISHADLLRLWAPQGPESEIAGYVMIAIGAPGEHPALKTACPRCKAPVLVPPDEVRACINICPSCDYTWPCDAKAEGLANQFGLEKAFSAMDQFSSFVRSLPGVEEHSEIRKHLQIFEQQKEKILSAVQAFEKDQALGKQQMAAMEKSAKEAREAHERKLAELKAPMEPLDGRALGVALLKSLGFKTAPD